MQSATSHMTDLRTRLEQKCATIAVIGLGYAGFPLFCEIARAGFRAVGIDKDKHRIQMLREGVPPFPDVSDNLLSDLRDRLVFTDSYDIIRECDVSIICVPTPLKDQYPDLSSIVEVGHSLREVLPETHPGCARKYNISWHNRGSSVSITDNSIT